MTFLYPYVLIALALPLLLGAVALVLHRRAGHAWRQLVSAKHPELVVKRPAWQVTLPTLLALLALVGIILAAARPINGYVQSEGASTGRNLLIALDISRSMETQDVSPSRLEEARAAAYELIEALPGDKIGLIVFSGEADVVVPLTYDHTALRDALEQVNRSWAGYGGTNFGLLLRCAMQNFAHSAPDGANALIILSDGEDTVDSSLQIAEEAKKNKLLVITVGIGTPAGGAIPDPKGDSGLWEDASGRHVISKLDTNALRRFSEATGGDFFTMNSGADLSAFAREAANKLARHEETFSAGRVPLDVFAWFAAPALLLLFGAILLGCEWKTAGHLALLFALSMGSAANAATHPESYAQAVHALREGKDDDARSMFSDALLSDDTALQAAAHLALGNMKTHATFDKLRRLYEPSEESGESPTPPGIEALQGIVNELKKDLIPYQDALAADKTLSAAQANIEKIQELIKKLEDEIDRLKQQQQQQQDEQNKDDKQDQQQDKQNKDDKQDQQQDKQNKDDKQDQQQDKQNKDDKQDQQQDEQNKDDKQDPQQNEQNKDDKQDQQQDKQNKDDKQDQQQDKQDKDDKQDPQQDKQNKDDKQDPQQNEQNKDDEQDQQQGQQGKDDRQEQQDRDARPQPRQGDQAAGEEKQPIEARPQELSDEEKAKQRAAGILRMHLDEEKGSPIPHDTRTVRPPSKDY